MHHLQIVLSFLAAGVPVLAGPTRAARADATVIELTEAPLITEVVPFFSPYVTTIKHAGSYTVGLDLDCVLHLGLGCQVLQFTAPTVATITSIGTKTTTYPCSTSTTFTKPEWDAGCGCTLTKTWWWTPRPCGSTAPATTVTVTGPGATVTATTTVSQTQTETATTTATATASCAPEPPLTCDRFGYLVQNTAFYRVDLETGDNTQISTNIGGGTNAIGYNVLDNFLGTGTVTVVRAFPSGVSGNVGDIDTDGFYWLSIGGRAWWRIDLRPGSATYGQILNNGTADNLGYSIADWVYIPSGGQFLWAVATDSPGANTSTLLRFSMDTQTWAVVRQYTGTPESAWGAQYGINTGVIYASDNAGGQIWAFPINGTAASLVTGGPRSQQNDGARCVLNVLAPQ
ncbi:hypothetical protein MMYC01_206811 [Madurella mycetomatis]|uniref:DUF6923 domain-containing protein n=1 Tax=Madurella mycetomatis TaxID=100816 RepID=A0A175VYR9_9PEZI|nr:hypothetical protein MMYC01_206811 [Madurella mycetomatis]